jgi:hypothetical protein
MLQGRSLFQSQTADTSINSESGNFCVVKKGEPKKNRERVTAKEHILIAVYVTYAKRPRVDTSICRGEEAKQQKKKKVGGLYPGLTHVSSPRWGA